MGKYSAILYILLFAPLCYGAEFYVSPSGNDSNPGTEKKPFLTLERARIAVRKANKKMKGDITVFLHGGEYPVSKPIKFDAADSGYHGNKVIYSAVKGEQPVITGSIRVQAWKLHDKLKNIYVAKTSVPTFRQLYVNDNPAIRSRTPNRESETNLGPMWEGLVKKIPETQISLKYWKACSDVPNDKLKEVEMVMVCHWYHQRVRIGKVEELKDRVEITPVNTKGKFNKILRFYQNNRGIKNPFYFENALEFIDAPYEWYHDSEKGLLYLALPKGKSPQKMRIEIPVTETLIDIQGGSLKTPVKNIEFRGITFQGTNWNYPSLNGLNMTQAAQVVGGKSPPPMIKVQNMEGLAFRGNIFRNCGGNGIQLFNVDSSDIEGNNFYNIAANGIIVDRGSGKNPSSDKQSVDLAIWNNKARKCGNNYSNGMFLFANNVKKLTVAHNHIYDLPYSGMQIGQQPGKMQDVGAGDNLILNNHIHHTNQVHGDGGGIYTLGGIQKGTVISGNYLHDITQSKWDHYHIDLIYLDNFSSEITVKDNVVNGGKANERNGSKGNYLENNLQENPEVEKNAGIKKGYNPRKKPME